MKNKIVKLFIVFLAAVTLGACNSPPSKNHAEKMEKPGLSSNPMAGMTQCPKERSKFCTREYRPVCAVKTKGPDCKANAPCPAIAMLEFKTYGNACTACADPAVSSHKPGACPAK